MGREAIAGCVAICDIIILLHRQEMMVKVIGDESRGTPDPLSYHFAIKRIFFRRGESCIRPNWRANTRFAPTPLRFVQNDKIV